MGKVRSGLSAIAAGSVAAVLLAVFVLTLQMRGIQAPRPGGGGALPLASAGAASVAPSTAADISLAPDVPAQPPTSECLTYATVYDKIPTTMNDLARTSTFVVDATIEELGPARWRTDSGRAPTEKHSLTSDRVLRLVRLSIGQDLSQRGASGSVVAWIPGGTMGCSKFLVGGYPIDLRVGDRFAFFLNSNNAPVTGLKGVSQVVEMWPIKGSVATSPDLGDVAITDVSAAANRNLAP
jgi:hypothetical protein